MLDLARQSADECAGGDRAAHVADGSWTSGRNQLTSVPAEIGQLTSLTELYLTSNQLTSSAGGDLAAHVADEVVPRTTIS